MGLTKASLQNLETKQKFDCLFNPTEYTIAKTNSWQAKPVIGKNVPQLDFTGGGSRTLTFQLFFDVSEKQGGDVRKHINEMWKLAMIDESKKNRSTQRSRPPLCLFQWGQHWSFQAVVASLTVRYTLFREDGTPVRATADVTFQEASDEADQPGTNPTSHAEPGRRRRIVQPRDTLALIAFEEYGDSNRWRAIAEDNRLDDPLSLTPGQVLSIPTLT